MAESRVEKFREYRKSIISDGSPALKTTIDTDLKGYVSENVPADFTEEIKLAKKLHNKKVFIYVLFGLFVLSVVVLLIVFGVREF